jgi:hypothetical protein
VTKKTVEATRGATLVEATLAVPIFIICIFFLIDLVRYFHVSTSLNHAAHVAVDLAAKLPVEEDTDQNSCVPDDSQCRRFNSNFDDVISEAMIFARGVARASGTGGAVELVKFRHFNASDYRLTQVPWNGLLGKESDVVFLRPGEAAYELRDSTQVRKYPHPIRADFGTLNGTSGVGWPNPEQSESWDDVLEAAPLLVHIEANMTLYTPIIGPLVGPIRVAATQLAYRKAANSSPGMPGSASTPPPPPTETPPATPTPDLRPTPTPIPTVFVPNTPTPIVINTPVPTNTPIRTPTRTPTRLATSTATAAPLRTPTPRPSANATARATSTARPVPTATPTRSVPLQCYQSNPCNADPCACARGASPNCDDCIGSGVWSNCLPFYQCINT